LPDNRARTRKKFARSQFLFTGRIKNHSTCHAVTNLVTGSLLQSTGLATRLNIGESAELAELGYSCASDQSAEST
jgi:hypothetical protein